MRADRGEGILLDQIEDRDLQFMLDIGRAAHHRALVELHIDQAVAIRQAAFGHAKPLSIKSGLWINGC